MRISAPRNVNLLCLQKSNLLSLQKRNLFNQCGQAAQGSDLSGQDGEDVAGRLSCSGGVDSKLSGTEKSRRKEQERNNGVTVSPNGEALLQTMLDRTLLLEASDLILSLSRGQPHDTPAWQFLARPHLEDGAEGGDEDAGEGEGADEGLEALGAEEHGEEDTGVHEVDLDARGAVQVILGTHGVVGQHLASHARGWVSSKVRGQEVRKRNSRVEFASE